MPLIIPPDDREFQVVCPYCNEVQPEPNDEVEDSGEMICEDCDRRFLWDRLVEVSYSTRRIRQGRRGYPINEWVRLLGHRPLSINEIDFLRRIPTAETEFYCSKQGSNGPALQSLLDRGLLDRIGDGTNFGAKYRFTEKGQILYGMVQKKSLEDVIRKNSVLEFSL